MTTQECQKVNLLSVMTNMLFLFSSFGDILSMLKDILKKHLGNFEWPKKSSHSRRFKKKRLSN